MIHEPRFPGAALPPPGAARAAASTFASDVHSVVDAVRPFATTLAMLGEFAIVKLDVALREAAGRPYDARWRVAFLALDEFVAYRLRLSTDGHASHSLDRLANFLGENEDLGEVQADARD